MAFEKSKILKSAEKFVATGKIQQAIDEYLKVLKENPKDWNLKIQIGDLMLKVNRTPEAIENFQAVADHYHADGFFLKAIAIYKRINRLDPALTDICMRLADLYLKQGLTMDAKSQLQIVAQNYLSRNQNKDAIETLQRLIEIEPDNLKNRNELAKAFKNEGMIPEAIQEYLRIAEELTRKNLFKECLAVLETAFKLDTRNTEVLQKLLSVYQEQGESDKGIAVLDDALKQDPSNSDILSMMAEAYASRKQYEKAQEIMDRAILNAGQKEPLWELKGDLFLRANQLEKAYAEYMMIVEREVQRKDVDRAVFLMQKITEVDSSFYQAWEKLVELYGMLRQNANLISAHGRLVDAYLSKLMYAEAAQCLDKLIKLDPDDAQHQEKLKFVNLHITQTRPGIKTPEKVYEPADTPSQPARNDYSFGLNKETLPGVPTFQPQQAKAPASAITKPVAAKAPVPSAPAASISTSEEKEFVSEHLIEAEVFNKYGLIDKAIEQLHFIVHKYPASVPARQKLKEIYLEKGDRDKAVDECIYMSRLFRKRGDVDQAEDLLSEARQINPNHSGLEKAFRELGAAGATPKAAPSKTEVMPSAVSRIEPRPGMAKPSPVARPEEPKIPPTPATAAKAAPITAGKVPVAQPPTQKVAPAKPVAPASARSSATPAEIKIGPPSVAEKSAKPPTAAAKTQQVKLPEVPAKSSVRPLTSQPKAKVETSAKSIDAIPVKAKAALNELEKFAQSIKTQSGITRVKPVAPPKEQPPAPVVSSPPPAIRENEEFVIEIDVEEPVSSGATQLPSVPKDSEFEEIDFYIDQGMTADARRMLESLKVRYPDDPAILRRMSMLDVASGPVLRIEPEPVKKEEAVASEEFIISLDEPMEIPAIEIDQERPVTAPASPEEIVISIDEELPIAQAEPDAESMIAGILDSVDIEIPVDVGDSSELSMEIDSRPDATVTQETALPEIPGTFAEIDEPGFTEFGELEDSSDNLRSTGEKVVLSVGGEEGDKSFEESFSDAVDAVFTAPEAGSVTKSPEEEEPETTHVKEELFEEEEDFFDLAAELEEGLLNVQSAVEEDRPEDGRNYSLEDILSDFKKGVDKQLGTEDYDTRYNLGIAYKEMGLVDEAIAEFQIAAKDPKRFLECCSMLGLCFVEKGMHKLAIKWYQKGLETPGYGEDEYQGVRFELAQAYEQMSETERAVEVYQEVYGINANYRNVSKKIKELRDKKKK